MKKKIIIGLLLYMFLHFSINAQTNLVPNGDFEYFSSCPTTTSQINLAVPWYDPNGATSDYLNSCSAVGSGMNVPNCIFGFSFQNAHSGSAYSGIGCLQTIGSNYREYIQCQFSSTLNNNRVYYIEFYVNLAGNGKYAVNNVGAFISDTAITNNNPPNPIYATPQIMLQGNPIITDTINWVKISGYYHSHGSEKFITIGNFCSDSATMIQVVNPFGNSYWAYYFIDDVTVIDSASLGVEELDNPNYISLFPNPNNGAMQLSYSLLDNETGYLIINNVMGEKVKTYKLQNGITLLNINETQLRNGIYFYQVYKNDQKVYSGKIVISK